MEWLWKNFAIVSPAKQHEVPWTKIGNDQLEYLDISFILTKNISYAANSFYRAINNILYGNLSFNKTFDQRTLTNIKLDYLQIVLEDETISINTDTTVNFYTLTWDEVKSLISPDNKERVDNIWHTINESGIIDTNNNFENIYGQEFDPTYSILLHYCIEELDGSSYDPVDLPFNLLAAGILTYDNHVYLSDEDIKLFAQGYAINTTQGERKDWVETIIKLQNIMLYELQAMGYEIKSGGYDFIKNLIQTPEPESNYVFTNYNLSSSTNINPNITYYDTIIRQPQPGDINY